MFDPYLTSTADWIDAEWNLHEQILAFLEISGPHTGLNTGAILVKVLGEYGLANPKKVHVYILLHAPLD